MEIKQYFEVVLRWIWLLALGLVLGAGGTYLYSSRQQPVYQAATRVQVMSAPKSGNSDFSYYADLQLAQTYVQTIRTRPIMDAVSEQLGYTVSSSQVRTEAISGTQLFDISVESTNPEHAAEIANTIVSVFIERNGQIQAERFSESEKSLQAQISQVDAQIVSLQEQALAVSSAESQENIQKARTEMARLEDEILAVKSKIDEIQYTQSTALVKPTPSLEERNLLNEYELRLTQLQDTYSLYQQIYTNLVVLGQNSSTADRNTEKDQLQSTIALYQQIRSNLISSYESIRLARLNSTANIVSIEPAVVPASPIRPKPLNDTGLGAAVGLLIAAAAVFLLEYFDDTLKTSDQVSEVLGLPVIGYIAELENHKDSAYVSEKPRSPVAEAFRTLRTNLEFAAVDRPLKTILVVSSHPGEGKSTVAVNLAVTLAQGGKKVVLIDADLRRPKVHRFLGEKNRIGLSDLFRDHEMKLVSVVHKWKDDNLSVVTSGGIPPNPADLLASEKMLAILEEASSQADVVIVDAPPFLVADASILSSRVDGVMFVIRPGKTPRDAALSSVAQLRRTGAHILGVVMNRIPRNRPNYYGGYRHYSGYYKGEYHYYDSEEGKGSNLRRRLFSRRTKNQVESADKADGDW